jgi:hypothetical protein
MLMFTRRTGSTNGDSFSAPRSYWREIARLDSNILNLSEAKGADQVGIHSVELHGARWQSEAEDGSAVYWENRRFRSSAMFSTLFTGNAIRLDMDSVIDSPQSYNLDVYNYAVRERHLNVSIAHFPDVKNPHENVYANLGSTGMNPGAEPMSVITRDHFDTLIQELRRGASGNYSAQLGQTT